MSEADVVAAGVVGLVRAYQAGALTPTDAARAYVSRIRRYDRRLNAFVVDANHISRQYYFDGFLLIDLAAHAPD